MVSGRGKEAPSSKSDDAPAASPEAREWSLAVIRAGREERWALHIGASAAVVSALAADSVFDDAPLPARASSWRSPVDGDGEQPPDRGGRIAIVYPRPTGPGAWERWVKADRKT